MGIEYDFTLKLNDTVPKEIQEDPLVVQWLQNTSRMLKYTLETQGII